eukprot:4641113-Pyramimonas_sp.AAC.1
MSPIRFPIVGTDDNGAYIHAQCQFQCHSVTVSPCQLQVLRREYAVEKKAAPRCVPGSAAVGALAHLAWRWNLSGSFAGLQRLNSAWTDSRMCSPGATGGNNRPRYMSQFGTTQV